MRKRKGSEIGFAFIGVLVAAIAISAIPVQAGYSEQIIDGTTCETELSGAEWSNVDGDVIGEHGVIVFPDNSTSTTRIITRSMVSINEQTDKMFQAEFYKDPKRGKIYICNGITNRCGNAGTERELGDFIFK